MIFEWYMARRYFRGRRSDSRFLSFIKMMAITGVAVGAAGLLIALSITHGFKSAINGKIYGFAPHVTIYSIGNDPIFRSDTLQTWVNGFQNVEASRPVVEGQVMIQSRADISGTILKGVPAEGDLTSLSDYIMTGEYNLGTDADGRPGIVLGAGLAASIGAEIGNTVTVYTIDGLQSNSVLPSPDLEQFYLSGIYRTGIERIDDVIAVADIQYVRTLYGLGFLQSTALDIQVTDPENIETLHMDLMEELPFPYDAETVQQRYGNIFAWVDLQEQTIPLVISAMILIAAFNLIGTVLMMVLERVKDIGILKTMGSGNRSIRRIFLLEGLYVAGVGLAIGIGVAILFNWLQATYHLIPLSEENYYMSYAPVEPHLPDFIIVAGLTVLLCIMASWLPARIASKTDPVKALSFTN